MNVIDASGAVAILDAIAAVMAENRDRLVELDQAVGDGDLGLTMSAGFAGAAADAAAMNETDAGKLFMRAGMAINKHAPSTMGTLMATGFMRGGKAVAGRGGLTAADMADFFQAFRDGVQERGKAKPGDKTILDALHPAARAALDMADKPLPGQFAAMAEAAEAGLEKAKAFMSQHGKAAVFREKTIGLADPGCVAFRLMLEGFRNAIGHR